MKRNYAIKDGKRDDLPLGILWNEMERTTECVRQRERKESTMNGLYHDKGGGLKKRTVAKKVREVPGNLSCRTALENCGFELACTISRCLLRPSARGVGRVEGSAIEIAGGPRGDCIQAHIETHPRDVSELSANRTSAFHLRHHLPRCDVHSKEKGGEMQGFGNRVVVAHGGRGGGGWDGDGGSGRCRMTRMRGTLYFDPINWTKRPLWKFTRSFGRLAIIYS